MKGCASKFYVTLLFSAYFLFQFCEASPEDVTNISDFAFIGAEPFTRKYTHEKINPLDYNISSGDNSDNSVTFLQEYYRKDGMRILLGRQLYGFDDLYFVKAPTRRLVVGIAYVHALSQDTFTFKGYFKEHVADEKTYQIGFHNWKYGYSDDTYNYRVSFAETGKASTTFIETQQNECLNVQIPHNRNDFNSCDNRYRFFLALEGESTFEVVSYLVKGFLATSNYQPEQLEFRHVPKVRYRDMTSENVAEEEINAEFCDRNSAFILPVTISNQPGVHEFRFFGAIRNDRILFGVGNKLPSLASDTEILTGLFYDGQTARRSMAPRNNHIPFDTHLQQVFVEYPVRMVVVVKDGERVELRFFQDRPHPELLRVLALPEKIKFPLNVFIIAHEVFRYYDAEKIDSTDSKIAFSETTVACEKDEDCSYNALSLCFNPHYMNYYQFNVLGFCSTKNDNSLSISDVMNNYVDLPLHRASGPFVIGSVTMLCLSAIIVLGVAIFYEMKKSKKYEKSTSDNNSPEGHLKSKETAIIPNARLKEETAHYI